MFKSKVLNSGKKDFFKKNKKTINKSSSTNIIDVKNSFSSNCKYQNLFSRIRFLDKKMIPEKDKLNIVITEKSISSNKFIDLIEEEINEIFLFVSKLDNKRFEELEKYHKKITLITDDVVNKKTGLKNNIICATHVKAILIKTVNNYYSFIGSGNPSYNARIEQYFLFNNKDVFMNFKNGIC